MQIYSLNDPLSDYDYENIKNDYEWIVVDYEHGSYEGSGTAVGLGIDGKLYVWNLGHCSCYGPMDYSPLETTLDEILKMRDNVLSEYEEELVQKVESLMGKVV